MKLLNPIGRAERPALQLDAVPRLGDVSIEIGLMLAVHLAFALAVVLTLYAFGIA